jgi:hypothetical protein
LTDAAQGSPAGGRCHVEVIDLFLSIPAEVPFVARFPVAGERNYEAGRRHGHDFMFHDIPQISKAEFAGLLLAKMDEFNIKLALIPVSFDEPLGQRLLREYPNRLIGSYHVDPNLGIDGVRQLERAHAEFGIVAATAFPAGYLPQVPIDDRRFYPLYAKCVELDIPICMTAGVPGPRLPMDCQRVDRLDEVCWFFPELKIVTRHGCEPWVDLAVKLMLKYPNLYYSTSAFAPKYYPKQIVDYANTRGADKVMFAGYFPAGLSYERVFGEFSQVPFSDHVWPKFLRDNAAKVFGLGSKLTAGAES